ncbi:flagellar assembly protein FliW [Gorillibacterium timonense]|uniref:flagellar assembly protein FliW n=1 Tax=Gorillibacterium timonense TaxID=1689269 RepID=UPI00071E06D4|nr:flagellar assembly protein FliW [Gorillibacterium timonense]
MAKVQITTAACGAVEVEEKDILTFPHGVPGFDNLHRFILVQPDPEIPFSYLQAVDEPELAFVVANPFTFFRDYEFDLSAADQIDLEVEREDQLLVFVILTIGDNLQEATANLFAPIVINWELKQGKQIALYDAAYTTKHRLIPADAKDVAAKGRG